MKKLNFVLSLVFCFIFISGLHSQTNDIKINVYICKHDGKNIIIDETAFKNENYMRNNRYNNIEDLVKKYIGKNRDNDYLFSKDESWLKKVTELNLGDKFYVSTPFDVFKSKITGYKLWNNEPIGYEFSPVLENTKSTREDTVNYDNNLMICTKFENASKIINTCIEDKEEFNKVTAFLKEYESKIVYDNENETSVDEPAEIKVFKANFLNTDKNEYAVSYRKRIAFDKYASGIFIVNDIGKVAKTIVEFNSEFNYYMLIGVVDYNGDGQYELLSESGYYEGIGYELYELKGDKYEIIANGFYWGV